MFQALMPLLAQCKSLDVKLTQNGADGLTVIVMPVPKDGQKDSTLRQPIKLEGSAEELDAGFVQAITSVAGARSSLVESVEVAEAAINAAKKAAEQKTVKAVHGNKSKAVATPAATPATAPAAGGDGDSDDDLDSENDDTAAQSSAAPAATPTRAADPLGDLFAL